MLPVHFFKRILGFYYGKKLNYDFQSLLFIFSIIPVNSLLGWKLGDVSVLNNNAGAELTVIDARPALVSDYGPDSWPMLDVTISNPRVPFYIPSMDVGRPLLLGQEPLCKIQLTQLTDGCILGITLSHTITDGMHWPALMTHIAARYRQVTTGQHARLEELITSPSQSRPEGLSLAQFQQKLPGGMEWKPEPFVVKPSFMDYIRAFGLLWGNASTRIQLTILHLPRKTLSNLKNAVIEGISEDESTRNGFISTGDVVQALGALAVHAAEGHPSLLPLHPQCMIALVQVPGAEPDYFGNAVHPMTVSLKEGEPQPEKDDMMGMLRSLASHIRSATTEVRSNPAKALQALYESHQVCDVPVGQALAYLAGQRLPYVTCTTNFIGNLPADQNLDFFGKAHCTRDNTNPIKRDCTTETTIKPLGYRSLTYPLARGMAVIRPSMPPYDEGLFLALNLTAGQLAALKAHRLLPALVPEATFLGNTKQGFIKRLLSRGQVQP
jgi:hypothetical protein